jgi:hypothetical protein
MAFTLSQSGMARHWLTERGPGWRWRLAVNGSGALVTAVVTVVIAATKFTHGAWIVVVLIPLIVLGFRAIHAHYVMVASALSLENLRDEPLSNLVLVLVGDLHMGVVRALRFAQSLSPAARAVYIETDPDATRRLADRWAKLGFGPNLVVLPSPYRSVLAPLVEYLDGLQREDPRRMLTIVLPEFIPGRWWQHLLHNQTALLIKGALLFRRGVVVVDVPFHLPA